MRTVLRSARGALLAVVATIGVLSLAACGSDDDKPADAGKADKGPIKIGFAIAESGPTAPYDVEPSQAAELAIDEINARGGVLGRKLVAVKKNTQSDKALASTLAQELVGDGVAAIVTTCDFDYGSPAAIVAQGAKIPGISLCASDPKFADTKTIGEYAFTMAPGSDAEATTAADWAYQQKDWRRAFILQDESIEYTKALGRYFKAQWKSLGGEIAGEDSFPGGDNVNIRAQATKIKNTAGLDFIYLPTWNPGGAAAIRQLRAAGVDLPIVGPAALDGELLVQTAGKVSDVFFNTFACFAYCHGAGNDGAAAFAEAFEKKTGKKPSTAYDLTGYNLVLALAKAIEHADGTDGTAVVKALEEMGPIETPTGTFKIADAQCHKPVKMPLAMIEVRDGRYSLVENITASQIPNIGDGNGCAA